DQAVVLALGLFGAAGDVDGVSAAHELAAQLRIVFAEQEDGRRVRRSRRLTDLRRLDGELHTAGVGRFGVDDRDEQGHEGGGNSFLHFDNPGNKGRNRV